ncbi:hypothetical protein N2152v2_006823 [Parachlorella kessleri]
MPRAGSTAWPAVDVLEEGAWDSDEEANAEAALVAARAAMVMRQYREAYGHFSTVVELGESKAVKQQGALGRCAAAINQGRWQQAASEARLAQELAPQDARGAVAEALAFLAGRQLGQALRCLKRAQQVDPTYPGGATDPQGGPTAGLASVSVGGVSATGATKAMLGEQCPVSGSDPTQGGTKLKRLITPPQNDCHKRALIYSRCNSTMDGGPADERPGVAAAPANLEESLSVRGALAGMHIASQVDELAARQGGSPSDLSGK